MRILVFVFVMVAASFANDVLAASNQMDERMFELGGVRIGVTNLEEVRSRFGDAELVPDATDDGSAKTVCYFYTAGSRNTVVYFETGPMGGFSRVTGIRVAFASAPEKCIRLQSDSGLDVFQNAARLGETQAKFIKRFALKFKRQKSALVFESNFRREATTHELTMLRQQWPNELRSYFDVNVIIRASFDAGRLSDFYIHRIESYN